MPTKLTSSEVEYKKARDKDSAAASYAYDVLDKYKYDNDNYSLNSEDEIKNGIVADAARRHYRRHLANESSLFESVEFI